MKQNTWKSGKLVLGRTGVGVCVCVCVGGGDISVKIIPVMISILLEISKSRNST